MSVPSQNGSVESALITGAVSVFTGIFGWFGREIKDFFAKRKADDVELVRLDAQAEHNEAQRYQALIDEMRQLLTQAQEQASKARCDAEKAWNARVRVEQLLDQTLRENGELRIKLQELNTKCNGQATEIKELRARLDCGECSGTTGGCKP